jgi:hypothetical protein
METVAQALIPIALVVVVTVLALGLWNMMRAGPANVSQKLMRARVITQFVAIVLMMGALWLLGR